MNVIATMQEWLEEQRALISSQQSQFCYLAAAEKITQEEALRNIGELIIQRKTLDKVQTKIWEMEAIIESEAQEDIPEDGSDDFSWEDDEEELLILFSDDEV